MPLIYLGDKEMKKAVGRQPFLVQSIRRSCFGSDDFLNV